jgi:hypothetical protein
MDPTPPSAAEIRGVDRARAAGKEAEPMALIPTAYPHSQHCLNAHHDHDHKHEHEQNREHDHKHESDAKSCPDSKCCSSAGLKASNEDELLEEKQREEHGGEGGGEQRAKLKPKLKQTEQGIEENVSGPHTPARALEPYTFKDLIRYELDEEFNSPASLNVMEARHNKGEESRDKRGGKDVDVSKYERNNREAKELSPSSELRCILSTPRRARSSVLHHLSPIARIDGQPTPFPSPPIEIWSSTTLSSSPITAFICPSPVNTTEELDHSISSFDFDPAYDFTQLKAIEVNGRQFHLDPISSSTIDTAFTVDSKGKGKSKGNAGKHRQNPFTPPDQRNVLRISSTSSPQILSASESETEYEIEEDDDGEELKRRFNGNGKAKADVDKRDQGLYFGQHSPMRFDSVRNIPEAPRKRRGNELFTRMRIEGRAWKAGAEGDDERPRGRSRGQGKDELLGCDVDSGKGLRDGESNDERTSLSPVRSRRVRPRPLGVPEKPHRVRSSVVGRWTERELELDTGPRCQPDCQADHRGSSQNETHASILSGSCISDEVLAQEFLDPEVQRKNSEKELNSSGAWGFNVDDGKVFEEIIKHCPGHAGSRHPSLIQNLFHGHHSRKSGHSRNDSEATIRPGPHQQGQRETKTHYHHHTYDYHKTNQVAQVQIDEELIKELREQNTQQAQLLTEQRIRIAVLQNEFEHMKKNRDDAVNASLFITQNLVPAFTTQANSNNPPRVASDGSPLAPNTGLEMLKQKIERLEKDNALLDNVINNAVKAFEQFLSEEDEKVKPVLSTKAKEKAGEQMHSMTKVTASRYGVPVSELRRIKEQGGMREAYEKDKTFAALKKQAVDTPEQPYFSTQSFSESETEAKAAKRCNNAFASDTSTVPNSPALNPPSSSQGGSGQLNEDSLRHNKMADVGLRSLDECLGEDSNEYPLPPALSTSTKALEPMTVLDETDLKAMLALVNLPAPSILKTGFDISSAKRGAEYDHLLPQPELYRGWIDKPSSFETSGPSNSNLRQREDWISEEVIQEHRRQAGRDGIRFPGVFKYGIQYVPEEEDENYLRTVILNHLPEKIELRDVLARVRGGVVESAFLTDTRYLLGGKSALVVFAEDYDAKAFVDYASTHSIAFGSTEQEQAVSIALIPTPTYPFLAGKIRRMRNDKRETRVLCIRNFPAEIPLNRVEYDISCGNRLRSENLVEMWSDQDKSLHLEFASIQLASSAFAILTNWHCYRVFALEIAFEADPCAGPLEELELPVPPRKPIHPRNQSRPLSHTIMEDSGFVERERKIIAALSNQIVDIPTFSGAGLKSSSWADEVIESERAIEPTNFNADEIDLEGDD